MKNNFSNENVVGIRKDRMKVALGSEKQVEVFSEKQVERILFYIQNEENSSLENMTPKDYYHRYKSEKSA